MKKNDESSSKLPMSALVALTLICTTLLLHAGGWFSLMTPNPEQPTFQTHPGRWGLLMALSMLIGLTSSLLFKSWSATRAFWHTFVTLIVVFTYFTLLRAQGGRIPIEQNDEAFLIASSFILACLVFTKGWFKTGKIKVPYLATGTWGVAMIVVQLLFHTTFIFPAQKIDQDLAATAQITAQTAGNTENIRKLNKQGVLNLTPLPLDALPQDFSEYKVATDEDILKGIYNIQKDKSDAFFSWSVAGRSSADSVFVLYDGPSQILWISGAENHQKTRLMARHGYYTNFGSFFVVWTLVLLMINTIHSSGKPGRRKTLPPGQR